MAALSKTKIDPRSIESGRATNPRSGAARARDGAGVHDEAALTARLVELASTKRGDPATLSVAIALDIGRARAGGAERALDERFPGLGAAEPHIAGQVYAALLDAKRRRELGAFYTPRPLARRLARLALAGKARARVVDPACGGGVFLLEAGRLLSSRVGEARASRLLFGVEKDPGALRVCRAVLEAAGFHVPEENLSLADALVDEWPSPPGGAFDVILGNPPYRNIVRLPEDERLQLRSRYSTFRNKCDLYGLFIEAATHRLAEGGRLAFLVSDSFMGTSSFEPLRRLLFEGDGLRTRLVERVAGPAFADAAVGVVGLVCERPGAPGSKELPGRCQRVRFGVIDERGSRSSAHTVQAELLARRSRASAAIPRDTRLLRALDAMSAAGVPLGDLAELSLGIKTGDDARFVFEGARPGPGWLPCVRGRDVRPWMIAAPPRWLDYHPEELRRVHGARPRRRADFDLSTKILLRETSGSRLMAAMDERRLFPLDTLHALRVREGCDVSPWYLLAVLNAAPTSVWYGLHHPGPHVKAGEVRSLPVPPPPPRREEDSRAAVRAAGLWIDEASSSCSHVVMPRPMTSSRSPLGARVGTGAPTYGAHAPVPSACLSPAGRAELLEELSRWLTRETEAPRRGAAQALLDEVVAEAYGVREVLPGVAKVEGA